MWWPSTEDKTTEKAKSKNEKQFRVLSRVRFTHPQPRPSLELRTIPNFVPRTVDESVKAYEQAIGLNPKQPGIYLFNLAASYRIAGRYSESGPHGNDI